jgi:hypothetical protein
VDPAAARLVQKDAVAVRRVSERVGRVMGAELRHLAEPALDRRRDMRRELGRAREDRRALGRGDGDGVVGTAAFAAAVAGKSRRFGEGVGLRAARGGVLGRAEDRQRPEASRQVRRPPHEGRPAPRLDADDARARDEVPCLEPRGDRRLLDRAGAERRAHPLDEHRGHFVDRAVPPVDDARLPLAVRLELELGPERRPARLRLLLSHSQAAPRGSSLSAWIRRCAPRSRARGAARRSRRSACRA